MHFPVWIICSKTIAVMQISNDWRKRGIFLDFFTKGTEGRLIEIHIDSHLLYAYSWLISLSQGSKIYIALISRFETLSLM